ncbi:hypothetical protein ACFLX4_03005 [Chloroflexota bacterium]
MIHIFTQPKTPLGSISDKGKMAYYNDRYNEAIEEFTRAIQLGPNFAKAFVAGAWAYNKKDEYDLSLD